MAGVITKGGLEDLAGHVGGILDWLNGMTLHLFKNPVTPAVTDTIDLYQESTFPGYSPVPWDSWEVTGFNASNEWGWERARVLWTCTLGSTEVVYGYYAEKGGVLMFVESNDNPFPMNVAGLEYYVDGGFVAGQTFVP